MAEEETALYLFFILFDFGLCIICIFKVIKLLLFKKLKNPKIAGDNKSPYITGLLRGSDGMMQGLTHSDRLVRGCYYGLLSLLLCGRLWVETQTASS